MTRVEVAPQSTGTTRRWLANAYAGADHVFPEPRAQRAGRREVGLALAFVVLGAGVSLLRQPGIGSFDTLWAEDGQNFLSDAVNRGFLHSLTTSYAGYYHLVPRLLAWLTTGLPAGAIPAAFAIESAVCTALVALLVYVISGAHLRSPLARLLVASVVLLAPLANEIPDSIANLHWVGLYAVFWVLLWSPRTVAGRIVGAAVVVLAAGSDLLVMVYLPLAVLRLVRKKDGYSGLLTGLLALGVAVQLSGLVLGSSSRPLSFSPAQIATGYGIHVLPKAVMGEMALGDNPHRVRWLALAALAWILAAAVLLLAWRRPSANRWLAALAVIYSLAIYVEPVVLQGDTIRYEAVPAMLLITAAVALLQDRPTRYVLAVALVVVWAVNLRVVDSPRGAGPRWSDGLQDARAACRTTPGGTVSILIPPAGLIPPWQVNLPCEYIQR